MDVFINKEFDFLDLNKSQLDFRNKLNKKIQNNDIQFEDVSCLCGRNDSDLICSFDRYGLIASCHFLDLLPVAILHAL